MLFINLIFSKFKYSTIKYDVKSTEVLQQGVCPNLQNYNMEQLGVAFP